MKSPIRLLQAAVLISAAVFCVLLFQVKADFSYISPFYARIVGIPFIVLLTIFVFWISSWSSSKAIIYGALILALILELIPLGLFLRNEYPSSYYIDPQGKIVLSTFPGNVFEGKSKGIVNNEVIAAYEWQQGKTKDPSGQPLRFYRSRPDGTILIFDYPVENGEILHPLDNSTFERYESQQISRAESFVHEGDLEKAKGILSNILNLDPYADDAYRLSQKIKQQEEQAKAEAEREAAEKAEAERLEGEKAEKEAAERAQAETLPDTTTNEETAENNPLSQSKRTTVASNHSRSYRTRRNYSPGYYSQPVPYYNAPSSSYYQQPSTSYNQVPTQSYREQSQPQPAPRVDYPSQSSSSNGSFEEGSRSQSSARPERKKGMSWKKKLLIGGAIIGGGIAVEEIIRHN